MFSDKARFAKGHLFKVSLGFNKSLVIELECKQTYLYVEICYLAKGKFYKVCQMFKEAEENRKTFIFSELC